MDALQPLAGFRVLDFSLHLPGAFLTRVLADLGAEVTKIEPPGGDPLRWVPPDVEGTGAAYAALNHGKSSLCVDLKKEAGRTLALELAAQAQVVVESFRPGVLKRLGLGFDALESRSPRVVLCSITSYGQSGQQSGQAGHDINYMARSGLLTSPSTDEGSPRLPSYQAADIAGGGLWGVIGILGALMERDARGRGRHIDVAMAPRVAHLMIFETARRLAGLREIAGQGLLSGGLPCYGLYATKDDRWMSLGALGPKFFQLFCDVAGVPSLAFRGHDRGEEGRAVMAQLREVFRSRTQAQWIELLDGRDCCCEPVLWPEEAARDKGLDFGWRPLHGGAMGIDTGFRSERVTLGGVSGLGEDAPQVISGWGLDEKYGKKAIETGALKEPSSKPGAIS